MAQTYSNWEYIIVNNCSSDDSLKIALYYAEQDNRITVYDNDEYLSMVENFNRCLLKISTDSKYCKIIHADDLLFTECIEKMVALAENNPSVGVVGSYVLEGTKIKCDGLPYPVSVFDGRTICQLSLNLESQYGGIYVFGSPTSTMIRSDLVRERKPFYNDNYHQVVDQEVCYYLLQHSDFGFIHQILTFSRLHEGTTTSASSIMNMRIKEELVLFSEYGPKFIEYEEYERRLSKTLDIYYKFLATTLFKKKGKQFWSFHKEGFEESKLKFNYIRLIKKAAREYSIRILRYLSHPNKTYQDIINYFRKEKE